MSTDDRGRLGRIEAELDGCMGIDRAKLAFIMDLKGNKRGRISEYVQQYPAAKYYPGQLAT